MIKQKDVEIALSLMFIIVLSIFTISPKTGQPIVQILIGILGTIVVVIFVQRFQNWLYVQTSSSSEASK